MRALPRLFLSYLLLIAALVLAFSTIVNLAVRRSLHEVTTSELHRELVLARALYDRSTDLPPDSLASLLGRLSGRRATVIARDGRVLGDSRIPAVQLTRLENHANRPEIRSAGLNRIGTDIRVSRSLGTRHLYVALQTRRGETIRLAVPLEEIDVLIGGLQRDVLLIGFATLLLAALFSLWYSRRIVAPLRRMAEAAHAMARGELVRRVRADRTDELGELAAALNTLASELQQRLGELEHERAETRALIDSMAEGVLALGPDGTVRRANPAARRIFSLPGLLGATPEVIARRPDFLELVGRVLRGEPVPPTELTLDTRHLLATAHPLPDGGAVLVVLDVSELRRLESVRRDFIANVSHELKTPLTAIRGYSETLTEDELPTALRRQFAAAVQSNAERLQRIVDDLLDLSRIESGGWRAKPELLELAAVAREAWAACAAAVQPPGVQFRVEVPEECTLLYADPSGLRQIFVNLFSNALRYTPRGGSIEVRARCIPAADAKKLAGGSQPAAPEATSKTANAWIRIEVRDTGSGIASAHLPRIFERFYRADPARSREGGGTGLGLAIVRHLVEAHGGTVAAESELGRGTTIRFVLPTAADPQAG